MKTLSIRWRLTLWYAACLACMLLLFGCLVHRLMQQRLLSRTDFELDEELHELALEVELAGSRNELLRQLDVRFRHHKTFDFQVTDLSGQIWFASHGIAGHPVAVPLELSGMGRQFKSVTIPSLAECRVAWQQVQSHDGPLIVQSILPLDRYLTELRDLRRLMVSVGLLMLIVAAAGGAWLALRALQPVDRMTIAAARMTASHLNERLQIENTHDELGRLALTFNQMLDRLEHAFNELRYFTAEAAHEIRTPLAVIRATAEVALRSTRNAEHYQESLQSIVEETNRLTALSNQLLTLAREEAGLDGNGLAAVNLSDLLSTVTADLEPLAEEKMLQFTCELTESVIVQGDSSRLRRVFLNLLDNAIKFTPEQGKVFVRLTCHNGDAVATIQDTGDGIAREHLHRLGERFYRVDPSRNRDTGGAGLGLAICQAIVSRHHGHIRFDSREGQGTEVRVELPLTCQLPENDGLSGESIDAKWGAPITAAEPLQ